MSKPGVIHKITIKDFVTYSDVEMYPGPNLNVVIGPNGTGKSTIVAAIILGLGGTPKTIGRGTKVSEYVKHDCNEARIDIELQGSGSRLMHTVTRIFNLSNQNTWYLDNKHVSEQDVKKVVEKLNIQVNNLCQFLPQDRVQDFAKMDKKELLVNTQKAVGRQDLVDKHALLINIRNEQKGLTKDIDNLNKKLENAETDIARLEGKVQNLNDKKKILLEIDHIKRKISWENYNSLLKTKLSIEKDRKRAEEILNKHKDKIKPVENSINEQRKLVSLLQNKLQQTRKKILQLEPKVRSLLEKAEDVENSLKEIHIDMKAKLQSLADYQNEIDTMRAKIDKLANDENSLILQYGEVAEIDAKSIQLMKEVNKNRSKSEDENLQRISAMNVLRKSEDETKILEEQLQEMENVKQRRLAILQRRDREAYNAVLWLRENKQLFRGQVYEPMMLELNVIDPAHAKYIENIVPMRDRVAFTCEYREDMNLLLQQVRDEQGLKINVVHSGPEHPPLTNYRPPVPIEQLRAYGFFAYTNSLITGPEAIIKYLCRMYTLHCIPIGDHTTNNRVAQIPEQIRLFFSNSHRFAVKTSHYTGEKSTRINDVESDGTFSVCMDYNSINTNKRKLDNLAHSQEKMRIKIKEIEAQVQAYENIRTERMKERHYLLQQKEQIKIIRERLVAARRTLNEYMQGNKTAEEINEEASNKIKDVIKKSVKVHKAISEAFGEFDAEIQKERLANLELSTINDQITHMENEIVDLRNDYNDAKITYNRIETVYIRASQDVTDAMRTAKKLSDGYAPTDHGFAKFKEKQNELPSDIEELNSLMDECQTKVECILTADDGEIKAYENSQKVIAQCREDLTVKEKKMTEYNANIGKFYQEWLKPLEELVCLINRNFGEYFESMGCAGEVAISHEAGVDEYSDYGLCIRVTYRTDEPLQELNRFVQSGGERAVATAVYMLSMQDLTAAPFRCVDEINQGMDPQNERRIFEILVKATVKTDTCQYFLITPKLIAALQFGTGMKVHVVHNGPYCEVGKQFSVESFIEQRRAMSTVQ